MHNFLQTIEILERTPSVLLSLLSGVSKSWVHGHYGEGTWSAFEVVGHLIVAEKDDWMPRVKRIMEHGESVPFEPFAHDATVTGEENVEIELLLHEFQALRKKNLQELQAMNLSSSDLKRTGLHPALGRVSLEQLLSTWAVHDLHHTRQACLAMAWQYREDVGPWRAYLNTLHR